MLIRSVEAEKQESDHIWRLETDIDDCSGEAMGHVMQILLENGAREVHYTPVFMKKNRPAYELVVLCKKDKISRMEEILFTETNDDRHQTERTGTDDPETPCREDPDFHRRGTGKDLYTSEWKREMLS